MSVTAIYVLLVCFWLLVAIAVFCLCSYTFVMVMYWKWNREDRQKQFIADCVKDELDCGITD